MNTEEQAKQLAKLYGRNWTDMGNYEREDYMDEARLQNLEVFYKTAADIKADGWDNGYGEGWYYWLRTGCSTSKAHGAFETEGEAIKDAEQNYRDNEKT